MAETVLTEKQIQEIEQQLSCPNGENGVEMGKEMNRSNIGMTRSTIHFLDLGENQSVLELGHGNCGHLSELMHLFAGLEYAGLEVSETMWSEARKANTYDRATFTKYDGSTIPFSEARFDRVMSVNTIYFWQDPKKLVSEIERVMTPGGLLVLTFADKSFMQTLPFVRDKFTLFGKEEIRKLFSHSNLQLLAFRDEEEQVISKAGDQVQRKFTMVKLRKQ